MASKIGLMARLVIKDNITSGGALASCQTLRLGGFTMTACCAVVPTMTSRVIENCLHVDSESQTVKLESSQTPDLKLGQGSDLNPPTHPDTRNLMHIRQQSQETVHHFWARFLLVKDKIKDCRDEDTISLFCNNCTDERILNAINRRHVLHFTNLATIV